MVTETELKTIKSVLNDRTNRQLLYYLDTCTRCAICKDSCHQYVTTKDVLYLPAYRAELLRRIWRRYFTIEGKLIPSNVEAHLPNDRDLDLLYKTMYACTVCRRCMYYCPFSIDTGWFTSLARAMLVALGRGSQILLELADAAIMKGENIDMFRDIIKDGLKDAEQSLKRITGDPEATIPTEKEGSDILYVALAGTHTILPMAIIFHEAKADWCLSLFEAANYGYFSGDVSRARKVADRIVDEAKRLGVKRVVLPECGHAYKVLKFLYESWKAEELPFKVLHAVGIMNDYLQQGKIKLKPGSYKAPVTYHDPCQVGRNGRFYEEPRNVVKASAADYREMTPNRAKNWCCGGGGGLVAESEFDYIRLKGGEKKLEQIKATGAEIVVTPCETCRLQLDGLREHYQQQFKISSLMDWAIYAMDLPGKPEEWEPGIPLE
jgi:Fe-S oxidoreductase